MTSQIALHREFIQHTWASKPSKYLYLRFVHYLQNIRQMEEQHLPEFHCPGRGSCGSIWAASEYGSAYKSEDGWTSRSLQNDCNMHQRVVESMSRLTDLKIAGRLLTEYKKFPQIQFPNVVASLDIWSRLPALQHSRVSAHPAIPRSDERAADQDHCTPDNRPKASAYRANHHRLIRPYLGWRCIRKEPSKFISQELSVSCRPDGRHWLGGG